jgi:hypothetical protein
VQQQIAQMGTVQAVEFLGVGPAGPDIYSIKTDKGSWTFRVWLTLEGKVDSVIIQPAR